MDEKPKWCVAMFPTVRAMSINPLNFNLIDDLNPGFMQICTVRADLSGLRGRLTKKLGLNGTYWELSFTIGIRFGRTELEAFVEWDEEV